MHLYYELLNFFCTLDGHRHSAGHTHSLTETLGGNPHQHGEIMQTLHKAPTTKLQIEHLSSHICRVLWILGNRVLARWQAICNSNTLIVKYFIPLSAFICHGYYFVPGHGSLWHHYIITLIDILFLSYKLLVVFVMLNYLNDRGVGSQR